MIDGARQTGRTTTMIRKAVAMTLLGERVLIIAATDHEMRDMKDLFYRLGGYAAATFTTIYHEIEIQDYMLRESNRDFYVFKDHHAYEVQSTNVADLKEMNRKLRVKLEKIAEISVGHLSPF